MTGPAPSRPPRKTGLLHLIAAAGYSLAGAQRLWREAAFRHEVLGAVLVLAVLTLVGAGGARIAMAAVLMLLLFAAEALNTALEEIVDHLSPGWSEFARNAKDLGSFAVLCVMIANGVYLLWVMVSLF